MMRPVAIPARLVQVQHVAKSHLHESHRMCYAYASSEDMKHAGNILIASLGRQPENALLHWAGLARLCRSRSWSC